MKGKTSESKEDKMDVKEEVYEYRRHRGGLFVGMLLIIIGIGFLLQNLFSWFSFDYVWPVIIIAVGLYFIMRGQR
jgi:hypothetical protein